MEKLELRIANGVDADEMRNVEGYAIVFDTPSEGLDWIETIHAGAVTEETIKGSDVLAKVNHSDDKILARSRFGKGSLLLQVDEKGLKYCFEAPETEVGNELLSHIKRGEIEASSFAFTVDKNDPKAERWYKQDGVLYRDIYKINRLYDISPVYQPAYEATTCYSARAAEVKKTAEELEAMYNGLSEEIDKIIND